jgi:hypothetical protein
MRTKKCAIVDCPNKSHQGIFVGNICLPCFKFLVMMKKSNSVAYKNAQKEKSKKK